MSYTKPTLAFINGHIITMDEKNPVADCLFIQDDKIIYVGKQKDCSLSLPPAEQTINLQGKTVLPGLIESHGHLIGLGRMKQQLNLKGFLHLDELILSFKKYLAEKKFHQTKGEEWIFGRGWDQNDWNPPLFPTHHPLTQMAQDIPVCFTRIDGHAYWVNQKAMMLAGIDDRTPDPVGGKIIRDHQGRATGVLIDKAMDLIDHVLPARNRHQEREALQIGIDECLKNGITSFHDACSPKLSVSLYEEFQREEKLDLRTYVMIDGNDQSQLDELLSEGPCPCRDYLNISAVKLYSDGALGSCGAALHDEYCHRPGQHGLLLLSEEEIYQTTIRALKKNIQVCTHAIGDKANTMVLNAYERALQENRHRSGTKAASMDARLRVEHAELLRPDDIPRFARSGIIASMQATHCTSDMVWIEDRLGKDRAKQTASLWRSLLDSGAIIANGSDAPIESINPFYGLYSSITRKDHHGLPEGGWNGEQRMTRFEALRSFTLHGAYASFQEKKSGSLEVGKWADLIVLNGDILTIEEKAILDLKVLLTVVGGKIVYQNNEFH